MKFSKVEFSGSVFIIFYVVLVLGITFGGGWGYIMNAKEILVMNEYGPEFVLRLAGVLFPPLGAALGYL